MSAVFSDCGRYRYRLDRNLGILGASGRVLFAMLNPSKAGAEVNDPTVTRLFGFTAAWGYAEFTVVNLFAHVATDPKELLALDYSEAMGPDNDRHIAEAAAEAALIVTAWGASYPKALARRIPEVLGVLTAAGPVRHLGLTKGGDPRHPLYLRGDTKPTLWKVAA